MRALHFLLISLLLAFFLQGCALWGGEPQPSTGQVTEEERVELIREAEVWSPIDTAALDIRKGPPTRLGLAPGSELVCRFQLPKAKVSGVTPKFFCRTAAGRTYKIKYGRKNQEIQGEILGTRILWALGFAADAVQPVRVRCLGCPEDPWEYVKSVSSSDDPPPVAAAGERIIEPALIESFFAQQVEVEKDQGLSWQEILELRSRDPEKAERQRVHREALALLGAFLQHADSKAANQTLGCVGGLKTRAGARPTCARPVVYIGDLGSIGGWGWVPFHEWDIDTIKSPSKAGYGDWMEISVWSDPEQCITHVNGMPDATLGEERISEAGRSFLAERLLLLSDEQWTTLFEVARMDLLGNEIETPDGGRRPVTAADRLASAKSKLPQITEHRCPVGPTGS